MFFIVGHRPDLYRHIVLSGGSTMYPGADVLKLLFVTDGG